MKHVQLIVMSLALGLAGCVAEHGSIPADALLVSEGNSVLSFRAPYDGVAYVRDVNAGKIVFSAPMIRGQLIEIDAAQNRVLIDANPVAGAALTADHAHDIFFRQSSNAGLMDAAQR
jgi:hypothetical protein